MYNSIIDHVTMDLQASMGIVTGDPNNKLGNVRNTNNENVFGINSDYSG